MANFQRGDIITVYFELPNYDSSKWHPGLIISNEGVYLDDGCYIAVMLTGSQEFNDKYSFVIEDKMLNKALPKKSQARCHLISTVLEKHITGSTVMATMKKNYVDAVVQRIMDASFEDE